MTKEEMLKASNEYWGVTNERRQEIDKALNSLIVMAGQSNMLAHEVLDTAMRTIAKTEKEKYYCCYCLGVVRGEMSAEVNLMRQVAAAANANIGDHIKPIGEA